MEDEIVSEGETTNPDFPSETESPAEGEVSGAAENEGSEGGEGGEGTEGEATAAAAAQKAYEANLKFKVYDKEMSMDPLFKDLIKDENINKKLGELHSKAGALDIVLPRFKQAREENQQLRGVKAFVDQATSFRQAGDWDSFFETIEVPDQVIFQYALRKMQLAELPAEQRAAYDQSRQAQKQAVTYQGQAQNFEQQLMQERVERRTFELDMSLQTPDVTPIAQAFDQKHGAGAFKQQCVRVGRMHAADGQDISARDAINEVLKMYGDAYRPQAANQGSPNDPATTNGGEEKPIIPNVRGRGASPVQSKVRSLDDLKKLGQARYGN